MLKLWSFIKGIILKPEAYGSNTDTSKAEEGAIWVQDLGSGDNRVKAHLDSSDREIATLDQEQGFLNKTFGDDTTFLASVDIDVNLNVDGNVTIGGELHADGLVLDTTDPNITLNKTGTLASADDIAGLTIQMSDGPFGDAKLTYDSSKASNFKIGNVNDGQSEILTSNHEQSLIKKTFEDPITFKEKTTPADPSVNYHKLYPKADGKFYTLNSIGDEVPLGSGGITKVNLYDSVSTVLPSGASHIIDGVAVSNDDQVLFSNLIADNNRIYEAAGVGSAITWSAKANFANGVDPVNGDMVIVQAGTAFSLQVGVFDGTDWSYNETVRHFNGLDYFEQSAIITSDLANNTSGTVFSVAYAGSENMVIDYSITRGSNSETGQINLTTDGTDVSIKRTGANIGSVGIELTGVINGSDVELNYLSDDTVIGTMKYTLKRWSNSAGGPAGVPSYTGTGGSDTPAAGVIQDIQIHGSDGNLGADADFKYDSTNGQLNMAGLKIQELSQDITINDNQAAFLQIINYPITEKYTIIEYSIDKNGGTKVGRLMIPTNGVNQVTHSDDFSELGTTGVSITVAVNGANVEVQYLSTSTGGTGVFKYSLRKW